MEKLRRLVNQIAYTPPFKRLSNLSTLQLSFIPVLSFASSVYRLAVFLRHSLYHLALLRRRRLPVPVISVGNLTWGGNGKTPMVEFLARWLADSGISPLILSRGYAGGDEAKMLQRHLLGTTAKIGVGANRAATAASFLERHDYVVSHCGPFFNRNHSELDKIGAAILDDGMQHLSLWRDLEIIMVNGMMPWGNQKLLPLGPLREPLTALRRADVVVVHHADLDGSFILLQNAFVQGVERSLQIGPLYVDRLDFSDHHLFEAKDVEMIRARLQKLQAEFGWPIAVITEKDYDREPEILKLLDPFEVLVLCSELQIIPRKGCTEDSYKMLLRQLLQAKLS